MTCTELDTLPKELIAHIACFADASSVLRLSLTCKSIRAACYDSLVFKHILLSSQTYNWSRKTLDVDAILARAENDVATWAKYALADKVARDLSEKECPLEIPQRFVNWLPELFVVKHPFMYAQCWKRFLRKPLDQKSNQVFCLAMAILASEHDMPQVFRSLRMQDEPYLTRDDSMKGYLWALCTVALTLRSTLRTRLAAWPYNNNAVVPHISFPRANQIPLRPLNDSYGIPIPFSRRAVELLGRSTSSFSAWDSWYDQQNAAFARHISNFTDGEWCGYYVHFGVQAAWLDPPMKEIHFRVRENILMDQLGPMDQIYVRLEALNCVDGIDKFDITGELSYRDREIGFFGQKEYQNSPTRWDWECRLTPFGLVGYWGHTRAEDGRISRLGIVWLWKKEWTEVTG